MSHTRGRMSRGSILRASIAPVLLALFLSPLASAQSAADLGCQALLDTATEMYRGGDFATVPGHVRPCLDSDEISPALRKRVLRLVALSHLRADRRPASREVVRQMLAMDPAYAGDAVLDPPDYVAFVAEVRDRELSIPIVEVTVPVAPAGGPEMVSIQPDAWPGRPIFLTLRLGASAYGGERGEATGNPVTDLVANAGFGFGVTGSTQIVPWLEIGVRVDAHYLPARFFLDWAPPTPLERDASSAWSALIAAEAVAWYPDFDRFRPGASLALGGVFSHLNGRVRNGLVIQPGLRAEYALVDRWSALASAELAVVTPGDALDLRTFSNVSRTDSPFDVISQLSLGVRYRLGS
jgi:hypothetical protein